MKKILFLISLIMFMSLSLVGDKNCERFKSYAKNTSSLKQQQYTFYGQWYVARILAYAPIFSMEDSQGLINQTIVYSKDHALINNDICKKPYYEVTVMPKDEFEEGFRVSFEKLGLTGKSVVCVNVLDKDKLDWSSPACYFCIKNDSTLIFIAGNVFFEAIRIKK